MHPSRIYRQQIDEILAKYHKHSQYWAMYNLTYLAEINPEKYGKDLEEVKDLEWLEYDSLPHERNHLRLVTE